jgi:hypothetical protein
MLRRASSNEETYSDGRESMIESVRCTTTSWGVLAPNCRVWVVGEYSIPKFLKTEEDVAQRAVVREELDLAGAVEENVVVYCTLTWPLSRRIAVLRTSELLQAFL